MRTNQGYSKMKSDQKTDKNKLLTKGTLPSTSGPSGSDSNSSPIQVLGWRAHSLCGYYLYLSLCLVTCGVFYLLCLFRPQLKDFFLFSSSSPQYSDEVTVMFHNSLHHYPIKSQILDQEHYLIIEIETKRYWTSQKDNWIFQNVSDLPENFSQYLKLSTDASQLHSREHLKLFYGLNKMDLPQASFLDILSKIMFHPFYLFQYFAVILWMTQDYVLYSLVILFITGGAIYLTTSETVYNLERLHDLAGQTSRVSRLDLLTGDVRDVPDTDLVPGDHIILKQLSSLPCDCILLSGRISVDESMLTGESVPVNKAPFDSSLFVHSDGKSTERENMIIGRQTGSILFSGTKILVAIPPTRSTKQSEDLLSATSKRSLNCIGVVYKTGFRSAKGQLIATLLNPQENFLSFFSDALYVIVFMALMCTALYIWSAFYLLNHGASHTVVGLKYLDALTIAVPPGLTASLTVATGIAINRLKQKGVFVSESTRVNWAGIINAACFDKTGTLTEERLHFKGVTFPRKILDLLQLSQPVTAKVDGESLELSDHNDHGEIIKDHFPSPILELMGTCHALSLLNQTPVGDPLEVELFHATGYSLPPTENTLDMSTSIIGSKHDSSAIRTIFASSSKPSGGVRSQPMSSNQKLRILKHFEFTSDKLRSGSLVQRSNKDLVYYCKGSPEAILKLVRPDSIPSDIHLTLSKLSKRGFRVIASCFRLIDQQVASDSETIRRYQSMPQSDLENDCTFLGLLYLSNALKPDTSLTIQTLRSAHIPCTMITGDHIHTAVAIGYDCGIYTEGIDVNIIDEDENSATGLQVSSMLTGSIVSYNLGDFLTAIKQLQSGNSIYPTDCRLSSSQIALSGRGLEIVKKRYRDFLGVVLESTQVFARMKPTDKQYIVQEMEKHSDSKQTTNSSRNGDYSERSTHSCTPMQVSVSDVVPDSPFQQDKDKGLLEKLSFFQTDSKTTHVLFCGDGANDMAALRAATVGVSLCETETSVAAPITSRYQKPSSVIDVIQEGRCSLVTAYVLVSFNIMYATIQLFNAIMMYRYGLLVGNNTYLIQDLFFTLFLGLAISITPPAPSLGRELPPKRFFTKYLFFKLFLQLIIFPSFQLIGLQVLREQSWYTPYECPEIPLQDTYSYETSVIASIGLIQLIIASIVSCIDHPFRLNWYQNTHHLLVILGQSIFIFYQIFGRESYFMRNILEIKPLPYRFCWILLGVMCVNGVVSGGVCWIVDRLKKYNMI